MASSSFNHECIVTKDFSGTTDAGGNLNISSLVPGTATIIGYNSRVGFVPYKYSDTGWALRATMVDSNGFQKVLANTAVSGSVTYRP